MADALYQVADVSEIVTPAGAKPGEAPWRAVRDPTVVRGAKAVEAGTTLLAVGGEPGKAFEVSLWEREHFGAE